LVPTKKRRTLTGVKHKAYDGDNNDEGPYLLLHVHQLLQRLLCINRCVWIYEVDVTLMTATHPGCSQPSY